MKSQNELSNLRVLCFDCHKKQPNHAHMHLKHEDAKAINLLRLRQGLLENITWGNVRVFADTSLYGLLDWCQSLGVPVPRVAYIVDNVYFDLAWPEKKVAIVVDNKQAGLVGIKQRKGWNVTGIDKQFIDLKAFTERLSRYILGPGVL